MLINLLEGIGLPLIAILIVIAVYVFFFWAFNRFVINNRHLTSKERKIINHKEGKVIEIYGYKPQPGSVKIFNGQAVD